MSQFFGKWVHIYIYIYEFVICFTFSECRELLSSSLFGPFPNWVSSWQNMLSKVDCKRMLRQVRYVTLFHIIFLFLLRNDSFS